MYEFFTSCLRAAKEKHKELLETPRARGGQYQDEIKELLEKVRIACDCDEISNNEAKYLIEEFKKIRFDNLPQERAAIKERERYNVGNKFYS